MWLQDFIDPNRFRTWHPPWFNEARLRESLRVAFERAERQRLRDKGVPMSTETI